MAIFAACIGGTEDSGGQLSISLEERKNPTTLLTMDRQNIPEPFLWEVFYYLTDACAAMVNGPSGASWDYEIVHRDIKPGNSKSV
jgi:serine/threonine protein kinase